MGKSLVLRFANASLLVCWSAFSEPLLNLGKPAIAFDADAVTRTVAQVAPATSINRPILRIGSQGEAVSELQAALRLLGFYTEAVDGVYRESTAIAVSRFQESAGLTPDGVAGPETWNRLFPSISRNSSTARPSPSSSNNPASSFPVPSIIQATTTNAPDSTPAPEKPAIRRQANPQNQNRSSSTPASSSAANPQTEAVTLPVLKLGMQGPAVTQLQQRLKTLGFLQGSVDGVFG
jgi:peptidoglycan hydrolase-like protein with peptidoglycan-binding domain